MNAGRKLLSREIDALPLKAWLRLRFGIGHWIALAWVLVALVLWGTNFQIESASNAAQAFVLFVMFPGAFAALLYGGDAAVAVAYRLGWTSRWSLYPRNVRPGVSSDEIGEQLAAEAKAEEAVASTATEPAVIRTPALMPGRLAVVEQTDARTSNARRVLYVVGVPAAMILAVGVLIVSSEFSGGGAWLLLGTLGLLVAIVPTISNWRAAAQEPVPGLGDIDRHLARPIVPEGLAEATLPASPTSTETLSDP